MIPGWPKIRIARIARTAAIAFAILGAAATIPAHAQLAASAWPMFHNNLNHTGQSTVDTGANNGAFKWRFTTAGSVDSSPAIGADGTIYVGDEEFDFFGNSLPSHLYAVEPDGTQKWAFSTGSLVASSPAIGADGTIYVGDEETDSNGNAKPSHLYAVKPDGTQKWAFLTGSFVESSPAIGADGTIYVGSDDGNLYAINSDGTRKWAFAAVSFDGLSQGSIISAPAIGAGGTIYVGSVNGILYAINPDGKQRWTFLTGSFVDSSPAIGADGTIYVGSGGSLYAINTDGTEKWAFLTFSFSDAFSSPAIGADGTIYVGSDDDFLYAINSDGSLKWVFFATTPTTDYFDIVPSSPAIGADGTIYAQIYSAPGAYGLSAINPDGTQKWMLPDDSLGHSSPAIGADGTIYVGSDDGNLYAAGQGVTPPTTIEVPPSFSWGRQKINPSSQQPDRLITIKNTGTSPLFIYNASLAPSEGAFDRGNLNCGAVIAPGAKNCGVLINFFPKTVGKRTARLTLTDNAGAGTQTVTLTGVGVGR